MHDLTSNAVIGKVAAEQLLVGLARLETSQRALVFAVIGMEMSIASIARSLNITPGEAQQRIQDGLDALRRDEAVQELAGVYCIGDRGDFHAHIARLQLEDWFCRWCLGFQVQRGRGRTRITCSDRCRREMHKITRQKPADLGKG
ncbi:hypothetical protein [Streptodolium elevatio]|uniref:RNA polymerase sigma factor 70 region 4 type 2 domain-containing protein n=1 Tax=Streptodolium elevatio TaxID=3157996 RepID=A0ABV3DH16_9ACTN